MKIQYLLFFIMFIGLNTNAAEVSKSKAETIAINFMTKLNPSTNFIIDHTTSIYYQNKITIYAINYEQNKGYTLVSADDRAKAVIAYSLEGNFDNYNEVSAVNYQIEEYCKEIQYIRQNNIASTATIKLEWKDASNSSSTKGVISSVGPLLTTTWSQGCYYNDSTPIDGGGPCQHAVTGCVATAMSQVINYYNFPAVGSGSHSYNSNYGILTANFGNTNYNWNLMANSLNSSSSSAEVAAVAQLISQAGISVDMMYSGGSSGAYSQDAANAFTHYFNFDNGLSLYHKNNFSDSIWEEMITKELDSLRPVYYDGSGTGGHAFVCDGYQGGGYFHFNWGWSGSYNGYFTLSNLNPGGMNFSNYCGAVIGMKPGIPKNCNNITDTLTMSSGNFSDGSYSNFYNNNSNCSWLINPGNAASIRIDFFTFDLAFGDSVYIYNGNNTNSPLLGSYGGSNLPPTIYCSSPVAYVQFISNSNDTAAGWSASYQSEYCLSNTIFTDISGDIDDGSGNEAYNNNTYCTWLIKDSLQRQIVLIFDTFKTESGYDFVNIYDSNDNNGNLLGSFSGQSLPSNLVSNTGNMFIEFISDGGVVDEGWKAHYNICITPDAPYSTDSSKICIGDSIPLEVGNGSTNFVWTYNGIPLTNITDTILYAKQSGDYKYTLYNQGCAPISSPNFNLTVNNLPNIWLGNDTTICIYNTLLLTSGNFEAYIWNTGDTTPTIIVDSNLISQFGNLFWLNILDSNNCKNTDSININLSPCLSLKSSNKLDNISIFPNPTEDILWIMNLKGETLDISIIDDKGKEVIPKQVRSGNSIRIDVSELSSGMYFIVLQQCTDHRTIKFIKP